MSGHELGSAANVTDPPTHTHTHPPRGPGVYLEPVCIRVDAAAVLCHVRHGMMFFLVFFGGHQDLHFNFTLRSIVAAKKYAASKGIVVEVLGLTFQKDRGIPLPAEIEHLYVLGNMRSLGAISNLDNPGHA